MYKISDMVRGIRVAGVPNSFRALVYTLRRDFLRPKPQSKPNAALLPRGQIQHAKITGQNVHLQFENGSLAITVLAPHLIFIGWDGATILPSYAITKTNLGISYVKLEEIKERWLIATEKLRIEISQSGDIAIFDRDGNLLRKENAPERTTDGWRHRAELAPEAAIYGLGERASGRLNLRPGTYRFWNQDAGGSYRVGNDPLYVGIPVYTCLQDSGSYFVFYDNSYEGKLTLEAHAEMSFGGGQMRYYFAAGTPDELARTFGDLTGRPFMPPRWALGYQQARWGYDNQQIYHELLENFRRYDLPLSALVMDIDHLDGYRVFSFDPANFPNVKQLAQEAEQDGVKLVVIVDAGVKRKPGYEVYDEGKRLEVFCREPGGTGKDEVAVVWGGWTVFPDFTNARTREWWGRQYQFYLEKGVAGFWHDMNEPAVVAGWGEMTLPRDVRHVMDGVGGDHNEAHNVYGLLMNRAGYEGLRKLRPATRPFIVSRSGWAGGQRYAANWTGDVSTSWESLQMTLPLVLNMSLSGIAYAGPDIGGFSGEPETELFVRWFQLGAFLPFFRTHSAFYIPAREPWRWGEPTLGMLRDALKLRYRLMPYWYSLAWQAHQCGEPLLRPLFYATPTDSKLWEISDAFLLGSDLLVAPVLEEGIRRCKVTLPQNNGGWYDFWNGKHYEAEQEIEVEVSLERVPLFARAGSIIPVVENQELTLLAYPADGVCRGTLYSDAGDGYETYRIDKFELNFAGNEVIVNWTTPENNNYNWEYRNTRLKIVDYGEWEIAPGESRHIIER